MKNNKLVLKATAGVILVAVLIMFISSTMAKKQEVDQFISKAREFAESYENTLIEGLEDYEFVKDYFIGVQSYCFVLDQSNKFIMHPNDDLIGTSIKGVRNIVDDRLEKIEEEDLIFISFDTDIEERITCFYKATDGTILGIVSEYHLDF